MRSLLSNSSDEDLMDSPKSTITSWWRTAKEYDEDGNLKIDFSDSSNLCKLSPWLKLLREMDRLALVAPQGLDDLRFKIIAYRAGEFWVPVGGIRKEDMEIPVAVTVMLVGLNGSGKSSLVNMMYSVFGRSGLIPFAQTSSRASTMFLEEHNVVRSSKSGFCVFDSRGLCPKQMDEGLEDVSSWMSHGVRQKQHCLRSGDDEHSSSVNDHNMYMKRKVNVAMVVVNMAEIHMTFESGDDLESQVDAIKQLFHHHSLQKSNENPIMILTHGDLLSTEERISTRIKLCEYIGISETTGAYDIACLTEQGILPDEFDPVTAYAVTEAVYRALMQADRSHKPKKKIVDWILHFLRFLIRSLAKFFAFLANWLYKLDHKDATKLRL